MLEIDRQIEALKEFSSKDSVLSYSVNKLVEVLANREYGEQELQHTLEMCSFVAKLLDAEEVEDAEVRQVVLLASVVHDTGRYLEEATIGHHTEITEPYIKELIDPAALHLVSRITKCVQRHSLSSIKKPETLEEKIVFDADNLTLFTEFGYKRWFFKAEDWGHVKNVQDADRQLKKLYLQAKAGNFLFLSSSQQLLDKTFYTEVFGT